jgi:peptide/nickel transport system ATP-binding protein
MSELLKVTDLSVHFPVRTRGVWRKTVGRIVAVDNVSFAIARGETLGLVGESGSGKTTLGLAILRGTQPTSGRVELTTPSGGKIDVTKLDKQALRDARQHFQMIFQDPYSSLNARMTVRDIIAEPLIARRNQKLDRKAIDQRVIEIARNAASTASSCGATRTPSAAASASASRSPARWCCIPTWWCATSRPPRSTSRSRRRSSTC